MTALKALAKAMAPYGLYRVASVLTRNHPKILMYHRFSEVTRRGFVSKEQFEKQLKYIAGHCCPVSLDDYVNNQAYGAPLPQNAVVITIDDGYQDFYDIAFPLLKKYNIPATLFVVTDFIQRNLWLWPDQVSWLLRKAEETNIPITLGDITLDPDLEIGQRWQQAIDYLLTVDETVKQQWIRTISTTLNVSIPSEAPDEFKPLSWEQLQEMELQGVSIGGHSVSHPSFGNIPLSKVEEELSECMATMNQYLGKKQRAFCYPNGQPEDYNETIKEMVRAAGYSSGIVAFSDSGKNEDIYSIRRYSCVDDFMQFMRVITGYRYIGYMLTGMSKSDC